MLVLQDQEWLQIWEKCSYAHRQVDEQPSKRSKKNDDKSAVAMLKKYDLHESIWPTVTKVTTDRRDPMSNVIPVMSVGRRSSNTRQLGCVFQDMTPPNSILRKRTDMQKPIQRVRFTKAIARHTKIRDQNPSLGYICPGEPHQRSPTLQNLRIGLRRRQSGKSKVPAKQRGSWPKSRKIGACLHQLLNLRNENLLSTPARRCI